MRPSKLRQLIAFGWQLSSLALGASIASLCYGNVEAALMLSMQSVALGLVSWVFSNSKVNDPEVKLNKVLEYCHGHTNLMWASAIVGIVLDCEFRDSEHKLNEYLSSTRVRVP